MLKPRGKKRKLPKISFFVILVFAAIILGDLNQRMAYARHLEKEAVRLEEELQAVEEENERLEEQITNISDPEVAADWAYSMKMVREGEKIVVFVSPEEFGLDSAEPIPDESTKPSNLEVWIELLFGG